MNRFNCRDYKNKPVANGTFFKSTSCKICLCSKGSSTSCRDLTCPIPATCDDLIRETDDCCNFGCVGPTSHATLAGNPALQGAKFAATTLTVTIIASLILLMLVKLKKRKAPTGFPYERRLISGASLPSAIPLPTANRHPKRSSDYPSSPPPPYQDRMPPTQAPNVPWNPYSPLPVRNNYKIVLLPPYPGKPPAYEEISKQNEPISSFNVPIPLFPNGGGRSHDAPV